MCFEFRLYIGLDEADVQGNGVQIGECVVECVQLNEGVLVAADCM